MPENQNVEYKSSLIRVLILLVIMGSSIIGAVRLNNYCLESPSRNLS